MGAQLAYPKTNVDEGGFWACRNSARRKDELADEGEGFKRSGKVIFNYMSNELIQKMSQAGFTRSGFPFPGTACRRPVWIPLVYINTFT